MKLYVGIFGEQETDLPDGERLLAAFYQSVGIFVPILRFHSLQQLADFHAGLIGKGKSFCLILSRTEYLPVLFPLVEELDNKTNKTSHDVLFELVLSAFPYPPDLCESNRERFLPPMSLILPVKGGSLEFFPEQILYFETNGRSVLVHTEKETVEIQLSMKALKEKLSCESIFLQPHLSFLVNPAWISHVTGSEIVLKNKELIPLSQKRAASFRAVWRKYLSSLSD